MINSLLSYEEPSLRRRSSCAVLTGLLLHLKTQDYHNSLLKASRRNLRLVFHDNNGAEHNKYSFACLAAVANLLMYVCHLTVHSASFF